MMTHHPGQPARTRADGSMSSGSTKRRLVCPHCGKKITLPEEHLQEVEQPTASEHEEIDEIASIWDRKPDPQWSTARKAKGKQSLANEAGAFGRAKKREPDTTSFGWFKRHEEHEQEARVSEPQADKQDLLAPQSKRAVIAKTLQPEPPKAPAVKPEPPKAIAVEPESQKAVVKSEPQEAVAVKPKAKSKPAPQPRPASNAGPSVLDVLDSDPSLSPGQRDTIRLIYQRFAPDVTPARTKASSTVSVLEVLDRDPNLTRGQMETIRTVLDTYSAKPK